MANFGDFSIDDRIKRAIKKLGWNKPTTVQSESLEHAVSGKDLLIHSKTGSGKTAVYTIAILESILRKSAILKQGTTKGVHSVIVVPSKELCVQTSTCLLELGHYCSRFVSIIDLSDKSVSEAHHDKLDQESCTFKVVIGTPSMLVKYLEKHPKALLQASLKQLVMDEADLLFGFGYEEEIRRVIELVNRANIKPQNVVVSATLNNCVNELSELVLTGALSVAPNEAPLPSELQLSQFVIKCENKDKFLILYALIKLALLKGRFLIFVNDIPTAFKLKLFLDRFNVYSCVLNNELPFNSRYHTVQHFNSGKLDILIATDQSATAVSACGDEHQDQEFSLSRGVDFVKVDNIINFNFPTSLTSYIHRVGRTARANNSGLALSFATPTETDHCQEVEKFLTEKASQCLRPFSFRVEIVEGFRYRVEDALLSINKNKIKLARKAELRRELLNSKKLDEYFKKHPNDRMAIKHDYNVQSNTSLRSMGFVPEYLIPNALKANASAIPSARRIKSAGKKAPIKRVRRNNPLKTFRT